MARADHARPYVLFVGVSTAGSRIHLFFPALTEILGRPARLVGVDVAPEAPAARHRAIVEAVAADEDCLGAVITSHKLTLYAAARDLMAAADPVADELREVNALARRADGSISGHARDLRAVAAVLPSIVGERFAGGADAVVLGAGGAGSAIVLALLFCELADGTAAPRRQPPRRVTVTDVDDRRLDALRSLLRGRPAVAAQVALRVHDPTGVAAIVAAAAPGSLVVNATGVGKDAPGSPLADGARFPLRGVAWDINYRGDLGFLAAAAAQARERALTLHDGWEYFLQGWTQALAPILGVPLTPPLLARVAQAARPLRPPSPPAW